MGRTVKQLILGIDGGATKTDWTLAETSRAGFRVLESGRLGPGSMHLLESGALKSLLAVLPCQPGRVGLFLAGCATELDRRKLDRLARSLWPQASIHVGSDRQSGFAAAFGDGDGVAVIAGTGSAVTGRHGSREDAAGGWGHLLGDRGGGYDLAIRAARRVMFDFDTRRHMTPLARDFLRVLGLNSLRELTAWAQTAQKDDLARLTPLLFEHASEVDKILKEGAEVLARLADAVCRRLDLPSPPVRLMGGVFLNQPLYARLFTEALRKICPGVKVDVCKIPASHGAVFLASEAWESARADGEAPIENTLRLAPTEQPNPRSWGLDELTSRDLVSLFVQEERLVEKALGTSVEALSQAVELVTDTLARGGRLFYVGAGTSGRLGVLDASEMPPTFGVPPAMVQAIIAGGSRAILASVEGAEDDASAGILAIRERGVTRNDAVCGITASGRTPFVQGALRAARAMGARTILLTCNPERKREEPKADVEVALPTGPELITGSTRLKAGTATKAALNILSSCAMIRLGRVEGNAMICLQPTNRKLRARATRIVAERLEISESEAAARLECANWDIRKALLDPDQGGNPLGGRLTRSLREH